MPSRPLPNPNAAVRDQIFWVGATALVLGELLAFWMLCSHQVRKAEVRDAGAQVERLAVADCLRYVPNATLGTCAERVAPLERGAPLRLAAGKEGVPASATVPVNHVYR